MLPKWGGRILAPLGSYQRNSQGKTTLERGLLLSPSMAFTRLSTDFSPIFPDRSGPHDGPNMVDIHNGGSIAIQQLSHHRRTHTVDVHGVSEAKVHNLAGTPVGQSMFRHWSPPAGYPVGLGARPDNGPAW